MTNLTEGGAALVHCFEVEGNVEGEEKDLVDVSKLTPANPR